MPDPGRQVAGRYTLEREIGRGGMGAVWLGTDERLGRQVALKRLGLLPGVDRTDLDRAEREARLAARLDHPHVVSVFNVAVDDDTGGRWLVMEYVEGATLAQLVRDEGALTPDEAAPLLRQVADALVAAHAAGIVHRDVKPSNILVTTDLQAKLTDFGIARIAADPALTQTGLVTGSPAYLAPEVAAGQRGDEAVDVWSLGATAFHVLSGRPPFDMGDNVLGGLYRLVNEDPPRLPDAGWLEPLLAGTMERDPERRWSMREVRDFLDGAPAPVVRTDTVETTPVPTRRTGRLLSPALLVGAAAALVVLVAVVLFAVLRDGSSPTAGPSTPTSRTPSASPSAQGSPTTAAADRPTRAGMESFVRRYVERIAADPSTSWPMLSRKFQRASGGFDTYRRFWDGVGTAHLLDVSADPDTLVVSYRVRFDNFGTGKRPTVLQLRYADGRYLIDGETTRGVSSG